MTFSFLLIKEDDITTRYRFFKINSRDIKCEVDVSVLIISRRKFRNGVKIGNTYIIFFNKVDLEPSLFGMTHVLKFSWQKISNKT